MSATVLVRPSALPQNYVERRRLQWSGDLGTVSEATDWLENRYVLIKRVGVNEANANEVESLLKKHCSLRHPHIVELLHVFPSRGEISAVLESPNESLWQFVRQKANGVLDETLSRWFFQQVIIAVHFCHSSNHWLKNIRLENVLLKEGALLPIVKLWGFVYDGDSGGKDARSHDAVLDYLAPECVEGDEGYDLFKADIWSCGVLLFTMLCGSYPFTTHENSNQGSNQKDCYRKNLVAFFDRGERSYPSHLSASCVDLLQHLLAPNPRDRITVEKIFENEWFTKNFPTEAREMNERMLEENEKMLRMGSTVVRDSKIRNAIMDACYRHGCEFSDIDIDRIFDEEQALERNNSSSMSVDHSRNNKSNVT
ncbi:hypothetical protein BSKO_05603 [Bryopsis sp. KO-2023]|nr:hypothetical protein BSKO_05603 [Bryopsis sp. KO-2023]